MLFGFVQMEWWQIWLENLWWFNIAQQGWGNVNCICTLISLLNLNTKPLPPSHQVKKLCISPWDEEWKNEEFSFLKVNFLVISIKYHQNFFGLEIFFNWMLQDMSCRPFCDKIGRYETCSIYINMPHMMIVIPVSISYVETCLTDWLTGSRECKCNFPFF